MMKPFLYTLFLLPLISCKLINPFYDEGEYTETVIEIENFTKIEVHNVFNIEFIADTETFILYKGGENILGEMTYSSRDETLKLNHEFVNWVNNFKYPTLEIHVAEVEKIDLYSSGNISSSNQLAGKSLSMTIYEEADVYEINLDINYTNLRFHSQGSVSGTFAFSGECPLASYTLNGSTNIQASQLISKEVSIAQNSLGNAHIYAEDKITARFMKSGNIYYKGNPKNIKIEYVKINNQKASGKLIQE